jgi:hypothetical protein
VPRVESKQVVCTEPVEGREHRASEVRANGDGKIKGPKQSGYEQRASSKSRAMYL